VKLSSPPSRAVLNNEWSYASILVYLHAVCRDSFTFTFTTSKRVFKPWITD
jgi:hypothetical protein